MENYLNKNIYKVSNPPGGHSSISLSWNHPPDQLSQHTRIKTLHQQPNNQNPNINPNKFFMYQQDNPLNYSHSHQNNSMMYGDNKKPVSYDKQYQDKNQPGFPDNRSLVSNI